MSTNGGNTWGNSTAGGYNTASMWVNVTDSNGGYRYRCKVTDSAGNVVYSEPGEIKLARETWTFTYDADGMRTKRTNGSTTYSYVYNGSQLSQMTVGSNTLSFAYEASGTPLSVTYNGTAYYYTTNLQGDITAILNTSGTAVVTYTYDAWGHILSTSGSMASTLGTHNPLRYRGYVYDTETGLYYLQSRYYYPQIGRFLNADVFVSTGQGLVSNNMFAYCLNNPILYVDRTGTKPFLFVWDYYYIHKQIQMRIVMQYGYAMEVYVTWDGGFGFLDLYDAVNNEYYEVKSKKQIQVGAHIEQMSNYDDSEVASWMFEDYIIDGSPSRGNNIEIEGSFEYNFYTVKYEYVAPGIIWYTVDTNTKRVTTAVAAGGAIVASALLSRIGKCAIDRTAVAY